MLAIAALNNYIDILNEINAPLSERALISPLRQENVCNIFFKATSLPLFEYTF